MTQSHSEYIIVGKVGSTYGIKGWLKILSYTDIANAILDYRPWYLEEGSGWKKAEIQDGHEHGKGIVAKLAGYENPEQARLLSGKKIAVLRSQLPKLKKNEYYWSDLIGLSVINQDGTELGNVSYLLETGSNDVLVVKGDKEYAIPYLLGDVIQEIDLEKREIHINWEVI